MPRPDKEEALKKAKKLEKRQEPVSDPNEEDTSFSRLEKEANRLLKRKKA